MDEELARKLLEELTERAGSILAAIQPLSTLVEEKGGERDKGYLSLMNKNLYRLLRTIFHLEAVAPDPGFAPEYLDLAGLCRDLCRQVESMAKLLDVTFDWALEPESLLSMADEQLVELALLNLLANALEAAGQGGKVTLRAAADGKTWRVSVQDDGAGLQLSDPEASPLLKQPGGLGLGLTAARRAAQCHGGNVVLDNGKSGGLRAVLSLPIRKPDGESGKLGTSPPRRDRWGGYSPLLVELSPLLPPDAFDPKDLE